MLKRLTQTILVALVLLAAVTALAAQNDAVLKPSNAPVNITSEKMVYDEKGGVVTFQGNVVADHGDLKLQSDKLTAYLVTGEKGTAQESIDHIVAEGNVRAKRGTSTGTCGKLTYYVAKRFLKMEKNPVLTDGPNSLSGEVINYYVLENRSEVVGGKNQRVKAVFVAPGGVK